MKHIRSQALIALVGILFLGGVLGLLALNTEMVELPDFGGTYVEGIAGRPNAINPIFSQYNDVDRDLVSLVFSGLTRPDDNGVVQPDLASRWTISPNGLVYTFTLRSDVRWQDGARFSADDVLFTIHAMQDPGYKGPPNLSTFWRTVAITEVDSITVRFQLTQPYAPFLNYTTIGILPSHLLKDVSASDLLQTPFNRHPIGTGPFQVTELAADGITLEVNPRYYGPRPYLARIQFKFYSDYESIFTAFSRGQVEGISRILPAYLPKARTLNHLTLNTARLGGYSLIFLNLSKPPFQEKSVRQALLYGMDRQHLINDLLQGQGLVASSPIEPGSWAYDSALNKYAYDVDKAKSLLEAAGWKDTNGDGVRQKDRNTLSFTLITNDDPTRVALATEIAKEWKLIGAQVNVQPIPASLLVQSVLRPRQFDAVLYEWRNFSIDPDQYENWHQTQIPTGTNLGQNYSGLNDRDISETLESARRTNDQAKRTELYYKFQERFADLVPALLLFYPTYTYGVDAKVRGVQVPPMLTASDRFRSIQQWYVKTRRVASNQVADLPTPTLLVDEPPTAVVVASGPPTPAPPGGSTPSGPTGAQPTPPPAAAGSNPCANLSGVIKSPAMDGTISGLAEIRGTATFPNMSYWKLEYRPDANPAYTQLFRSEQPVTDGILSLWSTKTTANGVYWLQLTVVDDTGNYGPPCQIRIKIAN